MSIKKIYHEYDDATGISIGIKYEKYLYQCQSKYQNIEIIKTNKYGNVLYLDGCFMLSQKNQDFYHNECLDLIPKTVRKILIIGGGDCAIASMLARKECVTEIIIVEIDDAVVNISKRYFPENFKLTKKQSKKIKIVINDGMIYLKNNKIKYDAIIVDSTDPVGDAKVLFSKKFIRACNDALKKNGVLIQQSGSPLKDMKTVIKPLVKKYESIGLRDIVISSFPMPLYPTGTWSFLKAKRA
ncbi:MAG: hypothetical protein ISQ60_02815 [Gammaproteobacteria bacterium]|jgi:spermidine synthase|nr:hypothetical protein [Gammaproteobacteria bacterium]MBL6819212.1 hypothetical protein [Gammaproteobacteria bacterium]